MVTKEVWSMSETPLPQIASAMQSADAPEPASSGEFRARARNSGGDLRPVSAFSPGTRLSEPPRAAQQSAGSHHATAGHALGADLSDSAVVRAPALLSEDELSFVAALRAAGIANELTEAELARTAPYIHGEGRPARRLQLLASYYAAEHDVLAAQRRQATDRWFLFDASDGLTAPQLLARLLDVVPELQGTTLERVGGRDGTLVLRADDDVCAVEDEQEVEPGVATVSVCDLVRAINVLLDRRAVRARLVGLIGDGTREGYVALPSVAAGIALSSADYLAVTDAESLLDLTGW